jgi:uncharacterized OB-fold protein
VNHEPWHPDLPVPYAVALVELPEQPGLRLTTNVIGREPQLVEIGASVEVVFASLDGGYYLPLFEVTSARAG